MKELSATQARGHSSKSETPRPRTGSSSARGRIAAIRSKFSHDRVVAGIPASDVAEAIAKGIVSKKAVVRLIPQSTLDRKIREGRTFGREEGDQISRLIRLRAYAQDVFESEEDAEIWLNDPNPALGGKVPLDLLSTDDGSRAVETVLRRIDHGDYS